MDNDENNVLVLSNNVRMNKNRPPVHVTAVYLQSLSQMLADGNASTFHRRIIADIILTAFPELAQEIININRDKDAA